MDSTMIWELDLPFHWRSELIPIEDVNADPSSFAYSSTHANNSTSRTYARCLSLEDDASSRTTISQMHEDAVNER